MGFVSCRLRLRSCLPAQALDRGCPRSGLPAHRHLSGVGARTTLRHSEGRSSLASRGPTSKVGAPRVEPLHVSY